MCIAGSTSTPTEGGTGNSGDMIGNMGLGLQIAGMFTGAGASKDASEATKKGYEFQSAVERNKAQVAEWQAQDALERGSNARGRQQLKTAALKGSQRARLAAAGQDLTEGSAFNILADTDYMGGMDERTITDNAEKEAWALRETARTGMSNAAFLQARADSESPSGSMFTSLLGSAGTVATNWYRLKTKSTGAY